MKTIRIFQTAEGNEPFKEWLETLDYGMQAKVMTYVDRLAAGGQKKNIWKLKEAKGLFELKVNVGPGYRVYFGEIGKEIILLLTGGDKKSQTRDIKLAKKYWRQCHV